jgi:ABC-2 type transport system ATP-binding protein
VAIMDRGKILALDTVPRLIGQHGGSSVVEVVLAEGEECPNEYTNSVCESNGDAADSSGGAKLRIDTNKPDDDVKRLIDRGVRFSSLRIHRPDLESVFLNLTGRRLRD